MHMQGDTTYRQCQGYFPGVMATIRHQLKKTHFTNFPQLLTALAFIDKARDLKYMYMYHAVHKLQSSYPNQHQTDSTVCTCTLVYA